MGLNRNSNVVAPLSGVFMELGDVPDPVFAEKMVGDGYAIDPTTNRLVSPIDGIIKQLHASKHAVTIEQEDGNQILIHVGIDTVKLKGEGFKTFIEIGDNVKIGDTLIEFDLDFLALNAKSLVTPVLLLDANNHKVRTNNTPGQTVLSNQHLFNFKAICNTPKDSNSKNEFIFSDSIIIANPLGMHARPSAEFISITKKFSSKVNVKKGNKTVNGKSLVALLSLEIEHNDSITIGVSGSDAKELLVELCNFIANNKELSNNTSKINPPPPSTSQINADGFFYGVPASEGKAVGKVFQVGLIDLKIPTHTSTPEKEISILESAISNSKRELKELAMSVSNKTGEENAKIFNAHIELLDDPDIHLIAAELMNKNKNAAFAWHTAYTEVSKTLAQLRNANLAARAADIKDVGLRVLKEIIPVNDNALQFDQLPTGTILIAPDLTPSETARLDKNKITGFATTFGGSTSHVAIIARSLGIPAIVGTDQEVLHLKNNQEVLLNAEEGFLKTNVSKEEIEETIRENQKKDEENKIAISNSQEMAITIDGQRVEVAANITNVDDAKNANKLGCDGVGLFRSEFIFMESEIEPSIKKQTEVYQAALDEISKVETKPFIIRTLDVGGDKPLSYLPIPQEENPFLGERGIRVSLENPKIFRNQIKAILSIRPLDKVHVMFPMISTLDEVIKAKKIVAEEQKNLGVKKILIGIMVEVPSTALMADIFAQHVDFFSIGANDLTQYTLAIDRGHSKLAKNADGLNPSVLKLIKLTCEAAQKNNIWVGICGGIASDLQAVPILLGLGVKELSVSIPMIPKVKSKIRELNLNECQKLAITALNCASALEVRKLSQ
jgi:phosphocarrier protein FPr